MQINNRNQALSYRERLLSQKTEIAKSEFFVDSEKKEITAIYDRMLKVIEPIIMSHTDVIDVIDAENIEVVDAEIVQPLGYPA